MIPPLRLLGLLLVLLAPEARGQVTDWPRRLSFFRHSQSARARGRPTWSATYDRAARLPEGTPELQRRVLTRLNYHRKLAGLVPVMPHPAVARAARAHAEYLERHTHTEALSLAEAHGETKGQPGFTGETVGLRLVTQGVAGGSTEAVTSELDPEGAVDILINSAYHRSGLLRQEARYAGFGATTQAVLDLFWEAGAGDEATLVVYPASGQVDVPPRFPGGETPDPLPGQRYPVGPPLSFGLSGAPPRLRALSLTGPTGAVPLRILSAANAPHLELLGDYTYAFPLEPLEVETEYAVAAEVEIGGGVQRLAYRFRTGTAVPGEQYARILSLAVPPGIVAGKAVRFQAKTEASHPEDLRLRWSLDDQVLQDSTQDSVSWKATPGTHRVQLRAYYPGSRAFMQKEFTLTVPGGEAAGGPPTRDLMVTPHPPWRPGQAVVLAARPVEGVGPVTYTFSVNDRVIGSGAEPRATWTAEAGSHHRFAVEATYEGGELSRFLEVTLR